MGSPSLAGQSVTLQPAAAGMGGGRGGGGPRPAAVPSIAGLRRRGRGGGEGWVRGAQGGASLPPVRQWPDGGVGSCGAGSARGVGGKTAAPPAGAGVRVAAAGRPRPCPFLTQGPPLSLPAQFPSPPPRQWRNRSTLVWTAPLPVGRRLPKALPAPRRRRLVRGGLRRGVGRGEEGTGDKVMGAVAAPPARETAPLSLSPEKTPTRTMLPSPCTPSMPTQCLFQGGRPPPARFRCPPWTNGGAKRAHPPLRHCLHYRCGREVGAAAAPAMAAVAASLHPTVVTGVSVGSGGR